MSRSVEYGLIAVDYLDALDGGMARARDISSRFRLPPGAMAKILQRLTAAGIVRSVQGAHGGYRLNRSLTEVSFLDLAEAIDGPQHVTPCDDESECARRTLCTVSGPVTRLGNQITGFLANISLERLLRSESPGARQGVNV